jgi:hypothetical protein
MELGYQIGVLARIRDRRGREGLVRTHMNIRAISYRLRQAIRVAAELTDQLDRHCQSNLAGEGAYLMTAGVWVSKRRLYHVR